MVAGAARKEGPGEGGHGGGGGGDLEPGGARPGHGSHAGQVRGDGARAAVAAGEGGPVRHGGRSRRQTEGEWGLLFHTTASLVP